MKLTKNLGMLLLGIWLVVTGIMEVVSVPIPAVLLGLLAIAAGVAILMGR